jgi:CspA family cold shock protein
MENGKVYEGIVKWFNVPRGWGWIEVDDHKDVFVHYTNIERGSYNEETGNKFLEAGAKVSFILVEGDNGKLKAGHVELI